MSTIALETGLTGLQAHATMLDVVGNNIANENTTAYKSQSVQFEDLVYQTLTPGTGPSGKLGGINPEQVGFGVRVGSTTSLFQQGPVTPTGRELDVALQGGGFFVVNDGTRDLYTRAGSFSVDAAGFLVDGGTGDRVQRFGAVGEATATSPGFQTAGDLGVRIPYGAGLPGEATQNVTLTGNLSATLAVGDSTSVAIQVFDTQGTPRALNVVFQKTADNTFDVSATVSGGTVTTPGTPVTFGPDGTLADPPTLDLTLNGLPSPQTVTLNLGTAGGTDGVTQFGGASTAAAIDQDGSSAGTLTSVSVDRSGVVQGIFSNGQKLAVAQLAVASFSNPEGLLKEGKNDYSAGNASGVAQIGTAGTGGRGAVEGGALEGSNVDIALELSKLIIAQRGFQANARTITAANEIEQDLTNIIR
jgi:flagellar hook protein FlgE